MENYTVIKQVGEGAHGVVYKAKHVKNGAVLALKKISLRRLEDGIQPSALREVKALKELEHHEHVIRMYDAFPVGNQLVLVFEFMRTDLAELLRNLTDPLPEGKIKCLMRMLLLGVEFLHSNHLMHRDLKPANLLISAKGCLKIADFGLARVFRDDHDGQYSHQVATRWYRAPELLYGARYYDEGVDLWSVGTIFAEMINNSPLFPGESDIEQLCCVLRALGTPDEATWPEMTSLPDFNKISFPKMDPISMEHLVPDSSAEALPLIQRLLQYSSKRRIPAAEALLDDYFFTAPLPVPCSELPIPVRKVRSRPRTVLFEDLDEHVSRVTTSLRAAQTVADALNATRSR